MEPHEIQGRAAAKAQALMERAEAINGAFRQVFTEMQSVLFTSLQELPAKDIAAWQSARLEIEIGGNWYRVERTAT